MGCFVRAESVVVGWNVSFALNVSIYEASVYANESGTLAAASPTPQAPGQQNRRFAVPAAPSPRFRSVVILHPVAHDLRPGLLGPSQGLAPSGPPQAAFNFAPGKFVLASISSLQVGRDATSCSSRPQARVHAGLTWLVNSRSAILMPDPPPPLNLLCFTERLLSL